LADDGAELVSETLRRVNEIKPRPQHHEDATFAPILKREDGLIDWSADAFAIERRIRGFQPWPNAYTTFNSKRLIIWKAIPETVSVSSPPGQVLEARRDRLRVQCGENTSLQIIELQLEGSRLMSARDFLNGARVNTGESLGFG
ncbi:MAG TPA: hypothetical protein VKD91_02505, partial [Pyrinomonadaceae bacterium]|nr:hypothetical protein [Pyrinomonadaceae bacterium]